MINREEAKHLSDVFKAYSEGKTIQWSWKNGNVWNTITDSWDFMIDIDKIKYRIKPEPEYRPYASVEEFLDAQKEHGAYMVCKRDNEKVLLPIIINKFGVEMYYSGENELPTSYTYKDLLKFWQHQDGTPCGRIV